ncbi:MAG: ABC transporter transmembrane domain-containing protein [Planctomycetota bacterium]
MPDAPAILEQLSGLLDDLAIAASGYQAGALTSEDLAAGRDAYSAEPDAPPAFFTQRLEESGASRGELLRMKKLSSDWVKLQQADLQEFIESGGFDDVGGTGGVSGFVRGVVCHWLMELSGDPDRPLAADFVAASGESGMGLNWDDFIGSLERDDTDSDSAADTLVPDGLDLRHAESNPLGAISSTPLLDPMRTPSRELDALLDKVDKRASVTPAASSLPPTLDSLPALTPLRDVSELDIDVGGESAEPAEPVVLLGANASGDDEDRLDLAGVVPSESDKPIPDAVRAAMAAVAESEPRPSGSGTSQSAPDAINVEDTADASHSPVPLPDGRGSDLKDTKDIKSGPRAIGAAGETRTTKEESRPAAPRDVLAATGRKRTATNPGSRRLSRPPSSEGQPAAATPAPATDTPATPQAPKKASKRVPAGPPEIWRSPSRRIESVDWARAERGEDLTRSTVGRIDSAKLSGTERETFAFMRAVPLFSLLPDPTLIHYVKSLEMRACTIGETVLEQGSDVDGLYLVYNGAVRLSHVTDDGNTVSLGMLGKGDIFGETSIATGTDAPMTARCSQDATLLVLPRATIEEDFARNPGFHQFVQEYVQEFYLRQFIRLWTGFGEGLTPKDLVHLVRNAENWKVSAGAVLYKRNAAADCFYVVKRGRVSLMNIERPRDGQPAKMREVDQIGEGEVFGATELLEAADDETPRRPLGALARTDAELLRVPRRLLQDLLDKYPELRGQFARRYHEAILTGRDERARFGRGGRSSVLDSLVASSAAVEQRTGVKASVISGRMPPPLKPKRRDREDRVKSGERGGRRATVAPLDDDGTTPAPAKAAKPAMPTAADLFDQADRDASQRGWTGLYRRLRSRASIVPWIRQHDETDCGAACLAMVAKHYGRTLALARLRDLSKMTLTGSSLANLCDAAEAIGFTTKVVRTTLNALAGLPLPCVANVHGNHYVVVWAVTRKHVIVGDPAIGTLKMTRAEFEKMWLGTLAMLMLPTEGLHQQPTERPALFTFLPLLGPYRGLLLEVLLASIVLDIFGLAMPLFTQTIVDQVIVHQNVGLLNLLLLGMMIVTCFQLLVSWLRGYLIAHISVKVDMRMLTLFFRHLLSLPLTFFRMRKTGDVLARFAENTKIRRILTESAIATLLDMTMVVVYIGIMFVYNVKLTLALCAFLPFYVALMVFSRPVLRRLSNQMFHASAEQESDLVESVVGVGTIKAMSLEHQRRWKWEDHFAQFLQVYFRGMKTQLFLGTAAAAIQSLASLLLLWYGASLVLANPPELSIGQLMAFTALVGMVMGPIGKLVGFWDEYQEAMIAIDRLNDVFQAEPEVSDEDRLRALDNRPPIRGGLELQDVTFAYDENNVALQHVSAKIEPGHLVALVGRSGCGKTTLTNLLVRLNNPKDGKILLDGNDITGMDLGYLRSQLGIVVQENFLFSGSVLDNIALGDENPSQLKAETAARVACAHQFIARLPFGYDTPLGERGMSLSGGERQRLCIARAIYRNPAVLVFDEATSALDYQTEREIMDNIKGVFRGRTLIVIAHRLSTITNANQIIVMDRGMIRESGTHDELIAADGLYAHLLTQQAGRIEGM